MDGHIERLVAACGLPGFAYRAWDAPEFALPAKSRIPDVVVPEPAEPQADAVPPKVEAVVVESAAATLAWSAADAEPALPVHSAILRLPRPAPPPPRPAAPPIVLATPPDSAPLIPVAARAPVRLPAPEPLAAQAAIASRSAPGRPPVVLPPPEDEERLIALPVARRPPVHVPVAPPARPARRFALLDEMAGPARRGSTRRPPDSP